MFMTATATTEIYTNGQPLSLHGALPISLPYLSGDGADEENPAMGWRALRLVLERDGLMKAQARALIDAAGGRALNIMFPMVSEPWEFDEARALFEAQRGWIASRHRLLPSQIRYGAMPAVPPPAEPLDLPLTHPAF